jgi:hypothetical protein
VAEPTDIGCEICGFPPKKLILDVKFKDGWSRTGAWSAYLCDICWPIHQKNMAALGYPVELHAEAKRG